MTKVMAQTLTRESIFFAKVRHITRKQSDTCHKKERDLYSILMEKKERKEGKSEVEERDI